MSRIRKCTYVQKYISEIVKYIKKLNFTLKTPKQRDPLAGEHCMTQI